MRKRLLIGLVSTGLLVAMVPGVAVADPEDGLHYEKFIECDGSGIGVGYGTGTNPPHWTKDFNPSGVNRTLRASIECTGARKVSVDAGTGGLS